jgi:hypothetical protein
MFSFQNKLYVIDQYQVETTPHSPPSRPAKPFGRAQGGDKGEVIKSNRVPLDIEKITLSAT